MSNDSVQQPIVETAARNYAIALRGDQRLKGFQGLNGALEADGSGLDVVLGRGLSKNRADQIVSQDVRPDFLPHEFRRLATQDVHLHGLIERPQIEFGVPARVCILHFLAFSLIQAVFAFRA